MATEGRPEEAPTRARKVPREDARPQTVIERQTTLSAYLLHRVQRRRERFLQRAKTTTIGSELLRAGFLAGCLLFDLLVIPEAIFLVPGAVGWAIALVAFLVAVGAEGWYYSRHFALREEDKIDPDEP